MAGKVTALHGPIAELVTTDGWSIRARSSAPLAVGAAVEAFVRPEVATLARIAAELPAGQAVHGGVVESLLFDGANSAVLLRERQSRFEFRIALPQTGRFADLRVGEHIHFSFDPGRAICFATASGHG